jgi:hypothetical protein
MGVDTGLSWLGRGAVTGSRKQAMNLRVPKTGRY